MDAGALVRVWWAPGNVMEGSARFQQFFFTYARLIAGLSDSKIRVSETTP